MQTLSYYRPGKTKHNLRSSSHEGAAFIEEKYLRRKPAIEFLVIANPKPDPFVARTQRNAIAQ
jgi:hypothetical protein